MSTGFTSDETCPFIADTWPEQRFSALGWHGTLRLAARVKSFAFMPSVGYYVKVTIFITLHAIKALKTLWIRNIEENWQEELITLLHSVAPIYKSQKIQATV